MPSSGTTPAPCWRALLIALALLTAALPAAAQSGRDAFRVCADPNNLPFSNRDRQGFENKLAELLAADLGLKVEYTWFPQRMGFIRNTLRAPAPDREGYLCDVVMGVPAGYELTITTRPYYRSSYALVVPKGRGLDGVQGLQDLEKLDGERRAGLRIGLFERSPAMNWLERHHLLRQVVAYPAMSGDPKAYPGQLVDRELASGRIDLAILWGPVAGYFATHTPGLEATVIPLASEPGSRFDFPIALGVRFGDKEWRDTLNGLLERNAARIESLLREYGVPLLEVSP